MHKPHLHARIVEMLRAGRLYREIMAELGVDKGTIWYHAHKNGLTRGRKERQDWPEIVAAYNAGASFAECSKRFGVPMVTLWKAGKTGRFQPRERGGSTRHLSLSEYIARYQGKRGGSVRQPLRRKILEEGAIPYVCAICGIDEWLEAPITLRLDHIDGDGRNHSQDNLRFVCPNCDSQQPTHGHRNRGRYRAIGVTEAALGPDPSGEIREGAIPSSPTNNVRVV